MLFVDSWNIVYKICPQGNENLLNFFIQTMSHSMLECHGALFLSCTLWNFLRPCTVAASLKSSGKQLYWVLFMKVIGHQLLELGGSFCVQQRFNNLIVQGFKRCCNIHLSRVPLKLEIHCR